MSNTITPAVDPIKGLHDSAAVNANAPSPSQDVKNQFVEFETLLDFTVDALTLILQVMQQSLQATRKQMAFKASEMSQISDLQTNATQMSGVLNAAQMKISDADGKEQMPDGVYEYFQKNHIKVTMTDDANNGKTASIDDYLRANGFKLSTPPTKEELANVKLSKPQFEELKVAANATASRAGNQFNDNNTSMQSLTQNLSSLISMVATMLKQRYDNIMASIQKI